MLFADDLTLSSGVDGRLEIWKKIWSLRLRQSTWSGRLGGVNDWLEIWGKILESKTKYLEWKLSDVTYEVDVELNIDTQVISKRGSFKYLGSIIGNFNTGPNIGKQELGWALL